MLPYLLLAVLPSLAPPNQLSVQALTRKNLTRRLERMTIPPAAISPEHVCAIPLKEVRAGNPYRVDPMPHLPAISTDFDRMARPAPVQACRQN